MLAIIDDVLASEPFGSERHKRYVEMRATVVARLSVEVGNERKA